MEGSCSFGHDPFLIGRSWKLDSFTWLILPAEGGQARPQMDTHTHMQRHTHPHAHTHTQTPIQGQKGWRECQEVKHRQKCVSMWMEVVELQ
ncbi:hypothetical protein AMECASPLE_011306 [Ameca splendens]|uniref:Uncharacterized protein n=1 Tax=Ameca splendens TaxID=208324 RepID=A0ABV0YMS7_9TELE